MIGAEQYRPIDDIEPREWAMLARARNCRDTKKLQTMLPKWIKAHQATGGASWRGFFDKYPPEFSLSELVFVAGAPPKLPTMTTPRRAAKSIIPKIVFGQSTANYIREFCASNRLIK